METPEHNDVMALHHFVQAQYHLMASMIHNGKIKDEAEFRTHILPVLEMLANRDIETSDEHIDKLTLEAREQIDKIRKGDT